MGCFCEFAPWEVRLRTSHGTPCHLRNPYGTSAIAHNSVRRSHARNPYGVVLVSRIDKIIVLFCKRDLCKRRYSANETYDLIDPTDCRHPIRELRTDLFQAWTGTDLMSIWRSHAKEIRHHEHLNWYANSETRISLLSVCILYLAAMRWLRLLGSLKL